MESNSRNRIGSLDIMKGLLICLVVIRHVLQYSVSDEGGYLTNIIWAIQMPVFFLISGYLACRKMYIKDLVGQVIEKAKSYLLPFASWYFIVDIAILGG